MDEARKAKIDIAMRELLLAMAEGNKDILVTFPNIGEKKAKVIGIDFSNPYFQPIQIWMVDKLKQTIDVYEDNVWSEGQHLVEKVIDYTGGWISLEYIKIA